MSQASSAPAPGPPSMSLREINDAVSARTIYATRHNPYSLEGSHTKTAARIIPFAEMDGHAFTVDLLSADDGATPAGPFELYIGQLPFDLSEDLVGRICRRALKIEPLEVRREEKEMKRHRDKPRERLPTGAWFVTVATEAERNYALTFDKLLTVHAATCEAWKSAAALDEWLAKRDGSAEAKTTTKKLLKPVTIAAAKSKQYRRSDALEPVSGSSLESVGPAPPQPRRMPAADDTAGPSSSARPASPSPPLATTITSSSSAGPPSG